MKYIFRAISFFATVFALFVLHILITVFLPYPLRAVNGIFFILIMILVATGKSFVIWLSFSSYFILELYGTTPFGVTLFAATISILLAFWLHQNFFTNHSWYAAGALALITLFLFRALFFLALFASGSTLSGDFPLSGLGSFFFWEALITSCLVSAGCLLLSIWIPAFRRNE